MHDLYGDGIQPEDELSLRMLVDDVCVEVLLRYVAGDILYDVCIGADVKEDIEVVESRESERDMAIEARTGLIFETGDVQYIFVDDEVLVQ